MAVTRDTATRADFHLDGGQLRVTPGVIGKTVARGGTIRQTLALTNTGGGPATVHIGSRARAFEPSVRPAVAVRNVTGAELTGAEEGAPWASVADYPTPIESNAAAFFDGKIYSGFGFDGRSNTSALYAYDPRVGRWATLADAADARTSPVIAFIGRKLYAVGGWKAPRVPDRKTEVYDPVTDDWSTVAPNPHPDAASGSAVLNGKLYVVGGCGDTCGRTDVEIYDPATDKWTASAPYPEPISSVSCGTIAGSIYCAGGADAYGPIVRTYQYDPVTNRWSRRADLPIALEASATTTAGQRLLLTGGRTGRFGAPSYATNQGYSYDPATDAWTPLPNSNQATYDGAGACGFYQIGGATTDYSRQPLAGVRVLPGNTDCTDAAEVPWLSTSVTTLTVPARGTVRITVTLRASGAAIIQPGTYQAQLIFITSTPYLVPAVNVAMTVTPT